MPTASVHGSAPIITNTAETATRSTLPSARLRRSACSSRPSPWKALTSVCVMISMFGRDSMRSTQVARHRRGQAVAPDDDADAARRARQVRRRLAGRVAASDHDHVLAAAALGVGRHGGVVDAGAREPRDVVGRELAPARPGGDDDRAGERVLAVVEVDADEPLGAARELDRAVEARQDRVEAPRLQRRLARQLGAGDPGGEAEVVLDPRARPGLAAGRPRLGHERPQPLGPAVDGGREPRGPAAEHDEVEALAVDLRAQAELAGDLRGRRVAQHRPVAHEDRRLLARDLQPVEHRRALVVGVDVVPAHRDEVALEQVAHLEGAPRAARGDEAQHAVPVAPRATPCAPSSCAG